MRKRAYRKIVELLFSSELSLFGYTIPNSLFSSAFQIVAFKKKINLSTVLLENVFLEDTMEIYIHQLVACFGNGLDNTIRQTFERLKIITSKRKCLKHLM